MATRARINLWPEGAVTFISVEARRTAMAEVASIAHDHKVWIGATFNEPNPSVDGSTPRRRNGLALLGPDGEVFEYFKRHLVPVAESYSFAPGMDPPPMAVIPLPHPGQSSKPEQRTYPRNVSITASICLDFSQPLGDLPIHPSLILAPARTWETSVGHAMALLADIRGHEVGAAVLWCDGGEGAVGGAFGAGRGAHLNIEQVGGRSWLVSFAIPREDDPQKVKRTFYGTFGDLGALLVLLSFSGLSIAAEGLFNRTSSISGGTLSWLRRRGRDPEDVEAESITGGRAAIGNLIDASD